MSKRPENDGLPCNVDAERSVLGSILMKSSNLSKMGLIPSDFALTKNSKIFSRMQELEQEGEEINNITLANALMNRGELESVDGISYIISLSDGLPEIPNPESYARPVKEKSRLRQIIFASQHSINLAMTKSAKSADILGDITNRLSQLEIEAGRKTTSLSMEEIVFEAGGPTAFVDGAIDPGISFGFPQFDEELIGLQRGCQYIIAGYTSSGKSAIAGNIAVSLAKRGEPVEIFSLEMSREIYMARILCAEAKVPLKAYIRRDLTSWQRSAMHHAMMDVMALPIFIDDDPSITVSEIPTKVGLAVREHKARAFIMDHIHRVNWQGDQSLRLGTEYAGVTAASWACALAVRKHNISSLVLCQLNRPSDKKREADPPTLSALRSTGALEQDATGVSMVHRPEMFDRARTELKGLAEIYHRKSRNGTNGVSTLRFQGSYMLFTDEGKTETQSTDGDE